MQATIQGAISKHNKQLTAVQAHPLKPVKVPAHPGMKGRWQVKTGIQQKTRIGSVRS